MLIYRVVFKRFIEPLLDLIYPRNCLICGSFLGNTNRDNPVCLNCWGKIEYNLPPFCTKCGRHILSEQQLCKACLERELNFTRAFSLANYTGVMRNLIHLFKFKNKTALAKPFAAMIADFFKDYTLGRFNFDYLAAMPLHPTRFREREYNQSQLISMHLSSMLGIKNSSDNLKRIKHTTPQSNLSERKRWDNVQGAFAIRNPSEFAQKNILLMDDLLTTGATCSSAAEALKKAGANQVYVLTLATTP